MKNTKEFLDEINKPYSKEFKSALRKIIEELAKELTRKKI